MKILIIEDDENIASLLTELILDENEHVELKHVSSSEDALPLISWPDLIITDFEYPSEGFKGVLPFIQKEHRPFILQSANPANLQKYSSFQLASVSKNSGYHTNIIKVLREHIS